MKLLLNQTIGMRPDSEYEISKHAEILLKKADAFDVLPTPIDNLKEIASISEISSTDDLEESFISSLKNNTKELFKNAIQKIRGAADLRGRVNYIPEANNPVRSLFPRAHEIGHQVLPWHSVDLSYLDDDYTLSPNTEDLFDREANFFASEIIFQGVNFKKRARDYTASLHAIFKLSDMHGASKQATLWRYVEDQDEAIAVAYYYPSDNIDDFGNKFLKLWKIIPSRNFKKKYSDIDLPKHINTGHPWVAARDLKYHDGNDIFEDKDVYKCGNDSINLDWQSWWNNHTLFILLRRPPSFRVIRNIFQK